jgi:hypothetical protein
MNRQAAGLATVLLLPIAAIAEPQAAPAIRPHAGPVEILKASEIRPGMKGIAWTVFNGSEPEEVPVDIIGNWKNAWGPQQDIILAKLGGKAARTNVAGGMSGSPVYVDGKLIGAIALRISVFSPDAICGITPIEYMLEINEIDKSRPADARTPSQARARVELPLPDDLLARVVSAGASGRFPQSPVMVPIETPLSFSGFNENVLREFRPFLDQMGVSAVMGGAAGNATGGTPAAGWQKALQPGDMIAGVLVSGDMNVTGLGTVTYNDGKRVLGFGHSFFNLGPVEMPMSKGEVLMVLSSQFQPNKFANATEIVGALKQDRHSGIMGELGSAADMIPVSVEIRSFDGPTAVRDTKKFNFNVFVQQKWTPFLMMLTVFNTLQGLNDFAEETTYRMNATVELNGGQSLQLNTMLAANELPIPPALQLAGWWGDRFNRLYGNTIETPRLKRVDAVIDLLPERRTAAIESAWLNQSEAAPGEELTGKLFLRPYRGERLVRDFKIKIPAGMARGEHRILISDADTLNRMQSMAGMMNRYIDVNQTVSLLNQERANNKVYVSVVEQRPTVYYDDKTLTAPPSTVLNALQASRGTGRPFVATPETASEQMSIPFEQVISGQASLRFTVK